MNPIEPPRCHEQLITYNEKEIAARSAPQYRTHENGLAARIYKVADFLTKPVEKCAYWWLVHSREATGKGARRGAGGEPKRYALLKAAGYFCLDLLLLPVILVGGVTKLFLLRPGRGRDVVRFMDATKAGIETAALDTQGKIHLASYNVAGLPPMVDAVKDVLPAKERLNEFAEWLTKQRQADLPLAIGMQEAFDLGSSEVFSNKTSALYPYCVTSAGWANVPALGGNSGLEFHSRVPIKSCAFYPFDDLIGFGVKCSARGFLRVELDLGSGKSVLCYVTHTQPHSDPEHQKVREQEVALIRQQMRYDRYIDSVKGIDRQGNYYLMGDLNIGNIDDETNQQTDEYRKLHQPGGLLSADSFYDPYLEEHTAEGLRTKGTARFLEQDVDNKTRLLKSYKPIEEPQGSFYRGPEQKDRGQEGYGTKNFYKGSHPTVANCRYDYILRLACDEDYKDPQKAPKIKGTAEIRHVLSDRISTMALSDHLLVSAIFRPEK